MEDIINDRCGWAGNDGLYIKYHDEEWGRQVTDEKSFSNFLSSKAHKPDCHG